MKPGDLIQAKQDVHDYIYVTTTGRTTHLDRMTGGEIGMVVEVSPGKHTKYLVTFLWNNALYRGRSEDFVTLSSRS